MEKGRRKRKREREAEREEAVLNRGIIKLISAPR